MRTKTGIFLFFIGLLAGMPGQAQTLLKTSMYYSSAFQRASRGEYFSFPVMWDVGAEQFVNNRVSLSFTYGRQFFGGVSSSTQNYGNFNYATISYGIYHELNYEVRYFLHEGDDFFAEGGYLSGGIAYRIYPETIDGPSGVVRSKFISIPYYVKLGTRSIPSWIGFDNLFVDYYVGLGFHISNSANRGVYKNSKLIFPKPSTVPLIIGMSTGYVF